MNGKQSPDAVELKEAAFRGLARREHSVCEIRDKLIRCGGEEPTVQAVVGELLAEGALSDERFVEQFCRSRIARGQGPVRILHDLQRHQIDEVLVEAAMAPYEEEWLQLLERVRQRRFGDAYPGSYSQWAKQARFLQQRGFTGEQISRVLHKNY